MIRNIYLLAFTTFAYGFLLDKQNAGGQTVGSQQYPTVSEFYHVKTELQDRLVDLRHDTDNKLVLLSSQLQQMFVSFKQEIADNNSRSDDLENKYRDLLQNHTVLQQEFDELKREFKNLNSTHQLQDLTGLQSRVNTISAQTHSLAVNEQARKEDFRALYNLTVNQKQMTDKSFKAFESETINNMKALAFNTSNTIKSLEVNTNNSIKALELNTSNSIKSLELNTNNSIKSLELNTSNSIKALELNTNNSVETLVIKQNLMSNVLGMKTQKLEGILNSSMANIQQQITSSNKRVSMTACMNSWHTWSSNRVVIFDEIQLRYGVNNINSFKSTGKFVAEMEGLYIVSVWIMSFTRGSEIGIYHNYKLITRTYINGDNGAWHSACGIIAIELQINDTVWIGTLHEMNVLDRSCFTIVKVK